MRTGMNAIKERLNQSAKNHAAQHFQAMRIWCAAKVVALGEN